MNLMGVGSAVKELVGRVASDVVAQQRSLRRRRRARTTTHGSYPGDHHGPVTIVYAPHAGSLPDPGEVVWAWVPYEEDHSKGKDRPVLIISRDADWLLGLPLSSVDHERDAEQEAAEGRHWVEIGRGPWDTRGKSSTARVNRVVRIDPDHVRRIGGRLDRERFDVVAAAVRKRYGS